MFEFYWVTNRAEFLIYLEHAQSRTVNWEMSSLNSIQKTAKILFNELTHTGSCHLLSCFGLLQSYASDKLDAI